MTLPSQAKVNFHNIQMLKMLQYRSVTPRYYPTLLALTLTPRALFLVILFNGDSVFVEEGLLGSTRTNTSLYSLS